MTEKILEHFSLRPDKIDGLIQAAKQYESDLYDKLKLGKNTDPLLVKQKRLKDYLNFYKNKGYSPSDYLIQNKIDENKVYELFEDKDIYRYTHTVDVQIDNNHYVRVPKSVVKLLRMSEDPKYNIGNINEILDIISIDDLANNIVDNLKGYVKIITNDNFYKSFEDTLTHDIELEIHPKQGKPFSLYAETKANLDNFHIADIEQSIDSDFYQGLKKALKNIHLVPEVKEECISSDSWGDIYDIIITYTVPFTAYQNIAEEILKQKMQKTPIFSTYGKSDKIKLSSEILNDLANHNKTSIYLELNPVEKSLETYNDAFTAERREAYMDVREYERMSIEALYDSFQKVSLWYGART